MTVPGSVVDGARMAEEVANRYGMMGSWTVAAIFLVIACEISYKAYKVSKIDLNENNYDSLREECRVEEVRAREEREDAEEELETSRRSADGAGTSGEGYNGHTGGNHIKTGSVTLRINHSYL